MVLHFLIQGRVQGVGFRWFVQREASELDLSGWVRNTEDGDVEVVAAGQSDDIEVLRLSLRRGLARAAVSIDLWSTLSQTAKPPTSPRFALKAHGRASRRYKNRDAAIGASSSLSGYKLGFDN